MTLKPEGFQAFDMENLQHMVFTYFSLKMTLKPRVFAGFGIKNVENTGDLTLNPLAALIWVTRPH